MFTDIEGKPFPIQSVGYRLGAKVERLRLPKLSFHGLRHTHATLLIEDGVSPKVVQERLGHANVSVTLGIYTHPSSEAGAAAVDLLASKLEKGGQGVDDE